LEESSGKSMNRWRQQARSQHVSCHYWHLGERFYYIVRNFVDHLLDLRMFYAGAGFLFIFLVHNKSSKGMCEGKAHMAIC
jgi:hypothetical protein